MSLSNLKDGNVYDVEAEVLEISQRNGTGKSGAWFQTSLKIQAEDKSFSFLAHWDYSQADFEIRKTAYKVGSWYKFQDLKAKEFGGYITLNFNDKSKVVKMAKADTTNPKDAWQEGREEKRFEDHADAYNEAVQSNFPIKKDLVEYTAPELLKYIKSLPDSQERGVCRNLYQRMLIIQELKRLG